MGERFYTYPTVIELHTEPNPPVVGGGLDQHSEPPAGVQVDPPGAQHPRHRSERAAW
jgi:hypothetical protein